MTKVLGMAIVTIIIAGCVATTKVIIKHQFPEEHLQYEVTKEWTKTY